MESFALLKYWRGCNAANMRTTTIATSALRPSADTRDDNDDGPFFDLDFAVPAGEDGGGENEDESAGESDEEEREFKFEISPDANTSDGDSSDPNCNGRLAVAAVAAEAADSKPPFPGSLLNSATKLRVFILRLRKPKSAAAESAASPKQQASKFLIRFRIEEVPIVSLFVRAKPASAAEKRISTDVVQKYLNKIKPLYVRVSKRYGEKLRFSGLLNFDGVHDRGVLETAAAAMLAAPPVVQRRDDSLLQQEEDGIQSAIAYCKRSFNLREANPVTVT